MHNFDTRGFNSLSSEVWKGGFHVKHMHVDSLLIRNLWSRDNALFDISLLIHLHEFQLDQKWFFDRFEGGSKVGFPIKLSHVIINFKDKFGWIKSESAYAYASRDYLLHILYWIKSLDPRVVASHWNSVLVKFSFI